MLMTNETELHEALKLLGKKWTLEELEETILEIRAKKKKKNKRGRKKNVKK